MREKLIDSALLIGLVVVCAVIVITLFFPSRRQATATATPSAETTQAQATQAGTAQTGTTQSETGGVPLISSTGTNAPQAATTNPEPVIAPPPTETGSAATAEESGGTTGTASSATATASETSAATAQPLPAGAFDLERVGFSFAGGTGACSVPLEAWRHIAVSRDILAKYPCGSEVTIQLDEPVAGHSSFKAVVGDTMNPSNMRTVNIYVAPDEPALQYGVVAGRLEP